jgi:hypothetical protein
VVIAAAGLGAADAMDSSYGAIILDIGLQTAMEVPITKAARCLRSCWPARITRRMWCTPLGEPLPCMLARRSGRLWYSGHIHSFMETTNG